MEQIKRENTEEMLRHSEKACYACNWNSRRKEREKLEQKQYLEG